MSETKHTPGPWLRTRVVGEPPFWMRQPLADEIDGLDPLTGCIIAFSQEERDRLDRVALTKATQP